jgi:hypothetical protein
VTVLASSQLTGYFDASGAPNQGTILAVAGFISFEPRWLQFESEWRKALAKEGVECFHMTEFIFNKKGDFKRWGQGRRERFITALGKIVAKTVVKSFASYVVLDDWKEANRKYKLVEHDYHPYVIASWSCVQRVQDWCTEHAYNTPPPLFIFEHGDKHQENMIKRVEQDRGVIVRTALKKLDKRKPSELPVIQLQSADFAAWQLLNMMREHQAGNLPQVAVEPWLWEAFTRLFTSVKYEHSHFSMQAHPMTNPTGDFRKLQILREPSLIRFADERGVPKR